MKTDEQSKLADDMHRQAEEPYAKEVTNQMASCKRLYNAVRREVEERVS